MALLKDAPAHSKGTPMLQLTARKTLAQSKDTPSLSKRYSPMKELISTLSMSAMGVKLYWMVGRSPTASVH